MVRFNLFSMGGCLDGHVDCARTTGLGTRVCNLTDRPVELQVRVGSMLKKAHTLQPGSSKRLNCKTMYKSYMPSDDGSDGMKRLLYYCDEASHPYIWIHDTAGDFSRMVKQQYISLEDLRDCSEIRISIDTQKGCISVKKRHRPDFC
ncbi:hypothetical protein ACHQM5_016621 [Ranunculus cassubicifolius]